ncbi:hypothetical protein G5I_14333 [Acromyrmex echinatior]|uniref:Uncharacterized protein n=1 Tax=Acromyrmex echinatior TaxID=103372 RepID=F4X7F4_ACREC|nr:hypothetical protein G5I_14333 [Acromyrmex echinatior]
MEFSYSDALMVQWALLQNNGIQTQLEINTQNEISYLNVAWGPFEVKGKNHYRFSVLTHAKGEATTFRERSQRTETPEQRPATFDGRRRTDEKQPTALGRELVYVTDAGVLDATSWGDQVGADQYLLNALAQGGRKCCCRGGSEKFTGAVPPPPLHRTGERILETNDHGRSEIRKPSRILGISRCLSSAEFTCGIATARSHMHGLQWAIAIGRLGSVDPIRVNSRVWGINAKLSRSCQRQDSKPNVTFASRHSRRNSPRKRLKASKLHSSGIGNYTLFIELKLKFHVIRDKKISRVIIHNILHISNFASSSARRENYCVLSSGGVVGMAAKLYVRYVCIKSHAGVSFICSLPGRHKMFENKTSKGTPFGMKSPIAKILVSKMNESPQAVLLTIPVTDYE